MRWAIQTNLGNRAEIARLLKSCRDLGHAVVELAHVPFSSELPNLDSETPTIFYGATGFVTLVAESGRWSPGVYFSAPRFEFEAYRDVLGDRALNSGARLTTLAVLARESRPSGEVLFVRPRGDTKEFAGAVFEFFRIQEWVKSLEEEETTLSPDCPVLVAEPVGLAAEWRLFVVDGRVVSGSLYRRYHKLEVSPELPREVVDFAQATAALYSPARAFVLDLARSGPNLYVVEYNCLNSSGFYASDTTAIVEALSGAIV